MAFAMLFAIFAIFAIFAFFVFQMTQKPHEQQGPPGGRPWVDLCFFF
jgi:hypothetical protein